MFLNQLTEHVTEQIQKRRQSGLPLGVPSGIAAVDELIGGGWERQTISYLLADSGKGKSWLTSWWTLQAASWAAKHPGLRPESAYVKPEEGSQTIWEQVANKAGKPPVIVLWQMEMSQFKTGIRLLTQATKAATNVDINSAKLRHGQFNPYEAQALDKTLPVLYDWGEHVWIEFDARTLTDLTAKLNALTAAHDIVLVIVDYFRLISEVTSDDTTKQAAISGKLKDIAKAYDCHVLSIIDMTREGQKKQYPDALAIKGGSAAQFDADIILAMSWDEAMKDGRGGFQLVDNEAHVILRALKNRDGEVGQVDLMVNLATGEVKEY